MKNQNSLMLILLIIMLSFFIQCDQKDGFDLDFEFFNGECVDKYANDSLFSAIRNLERLEFEQAFKYYPELELIDASEDMTIIEGQKPYLSGLGQYYYGYSRDSKDLLVLSVFLKNKFNLTNTLFDKMLCGSLRLDPNNIFSIFLLAKHRLKNNKPGDAYYLLTHLNLKVGGCQYLENIMSEISEQYEIVYNKKFTFDEFIRQEIRYYPQ